MLEMTREGERVPGGLDAVPHDNAGNRRGGMDVRMVTDYVCLECMPRMYASNNKVAKG